MQQRNQAIKDRIKKLIKKFNFKSPMTIMLLALGILFGGIFVWKMIQGIMMKRYLATMGAPVEVVSTMKVAYADWQPTIKAIGTMRAIKGVNVTTELAGSVKEIFFTPGSKVKKGDLLVQLNANTELGQLHALEASAALAKITYKRDLAQYKVHAVSKQTVDTDKYNLQNLQAQVAQQAATVAKKTIRAPFDGQLGVSNVNPGQYVNVGDTIVNLQSYHPIYVDFYVPQQRLAQLKIGQTVILTSDSYPHQSFTGKITTIEPMVDTSTRNVEVEATMPNPKQMLVPGMFASVKVHADKPKQYLTLPQAAVVFNSYGDIVYLVQEQGKDEKGKPIYIAKQVFVTTGETRGDQITITKGLKKGDIVVTSGQVKLKNGSRISMNNTIQPANNPNPVVKNGEG